uniref:Uncharacterized protein n=1 Tax=Timema douglasi TaxID=61478 RepID=A0A7R8ZDN9_TIMDO|nr:unnamed protein product [Timema douglasi]
MGAAVVPIVVFTAFWGVVGIVLPFVVPKGPNRGTYSSPVASLVLTDSSQLTAKSFEKLPNQIMYPYAEAYDLQKLVFSSFHFRQSKFSWLCCYMAQMNPLIGPRLSKHTILLMAREWVLDDLSLDIFVLPPPRLTHRSRTGCATSELALSLRMLSSRVTWVALNLKQHDSRISVTAGDSESRFWWVRNHAFKGQGTLQRAWENPSYTHSPVSEGRKTPCSRCLPRGGGGILPQGSTISLYPTLPSGDLVEVPTPALLKDRLRILS